MALPTKAQWTVLKNNAGISKAPWWKLADAAVGPALGKLESTKAAWKKEKVYTNAGPYVIALKNVHEAFQKFLYKKDLSAAGPLKAQIEGWIVEVAAKHKKIQAMLPALKEERAVEMIDLIDSI